MKTPQEAFKELTQSVLTIYKFFRIEMTKRGVIQMEKKDEEIIYHNWFLQRDYNYDFTIHSSHHKEWYPIVLVILGSKGFMIRFDWKIADKKQVLHSMSESFPMESLSQENILDLLAKFLKREISYDTKSRKKFLKEFNSLQNMEE